MKGCRRRGHRRGPGRPVRRLPPRPPRFHARSTHSHRGRPGQPTRRTYAVLDAEEGPGGAWRHRWKSLRMATVNGISDLPGIPQPDVDPAEPSSAFLTRYFAGYERELGIVVERPVKALAVEREDADPAGRLRITDVRRRMVGARCHQRHGNLDQAFLADLSRTVHVQGAPAPRRRLRLRRRVPRTARHRRGRRHFRRRAAR